MTITLSTATIYGYNSHSGFITYRKLSILTIICQNPLRHYTATELLHNRVLSAQKAILALFIKHLNYQTFNAALPHHRKKQKVNNEQLPGNFFLAIFTKLKYQ